MISITAIKYLINSKLNYYIKSIKILSTDNEYITCLVNDDYIFNIILNPQNPNYGDGKDILDTIRPELNIQIPKINYSFISDDVVIKGYKKIEGVPLNPNIFKLMSKEEQDELIKDISLFLKQLHSIKRTNKTNKKELLLKEIEFIKSNLYNLLTNNEKEYINSFIEYLNSIPDLTTEECLSHNSLQYSRFIINEDNKLVGVVGFDDMDFNSIYTDYIALLEDEEIGSRIIIESNLDLNTIKTYKEIQDRYYPIKIMLYGLKNNRNDILEKGRRIIDMPIKKID